MSLLQLGQRATLHLQMCKRDYLEDLVGPLLLDRLGDIVEEVDTEAVIVGTTHIVVEEEGEKKEAQALNNLSRLNVL